MFSQHPKINFWVLGRDQERTEIRCSETPRKIQFSSNRELSAGTLWPKMPWIAELIETWGGGGEHDGRAKIADTSKKFHFQSA